jgi:hypothetical protein
MIHAWTYTGPHVSRPEQPRVHLNFWKLEGDPATNQEVVFKDFVFVPEDAPTPVADGPGSGPPPAQAGRLLPPAPNPFNPQTTLRFSLAQADNVELAIYDLAGRQVRVLVSEHLAAGDHRTTWDGRDDVGRLLASGTYLVRLRGSDYVETRRVALVK